MAGGRFDKLAGKVRPGTYINFETTKHNTLGISERGTMILPLLNHNYGPTGEFVELTAESMDGKPDILGYSIYDDDPNRQMLLIREAFKKASTVYVYRVNGGTKATGEIKGITATAKYPGTRGNALTFAILENPVENYDIEVFLDGNRVALLENISTIEEMNEQGYIVFGGAYIDEVMTYTEVTPNAGDNPHAKGWYVLADGTYSASTDTQAKRGTTYYKPVYVEEIDPDENPKEAGYYEEDGEGYKPTEDETVEAGKSYYSLSYGAVTDADTGDNPAAEGWYELEDGNYSVSTDTSVNTADTYYEATTEEQEITDALPIIAGINLTGATDTEATNSEVTAFMDKWESISFNTVALPVTAAALQSAAKAKIKYMRESIGKGVQVVMPETAAGDYEGVINVTNSVGWTETETIEGKRVEKRVELTTAEACAWVAAATAAATNVQSNTYVEYEGAAFVINQKTHEQAVAAINNGEFFFSMSEGGAVVVEYDINTLVTYGNGDNKDKDKSYCKNRVIRVFDTFAEAVQLNFPPNMYDNNSVGWEIMEGVGRSILKQFDDAGAIDEVDYDNDFLVDRSLSEGDETFFNVGLKATDSAEKLYFTISTR